LFVRRKSWYNEGLWQILPCS